MIYLLIPQDLFQDLAPSLEVFKASSEQPGLVEDVPAYGRGCWN